MCGISGLVIPEKLQTDRRTIQHAINALLTLSESRGKEAAGVALVSDQDICVFKQALPASRLVKTDGYQQLFTTKNNHWQAAIGHSRLVTNGKLELNDNNQPVISNGLVGVHNGIIVNDQALWTQHPTLQRRFNVDTEAFLALLRQNVTLEKDITRAIGQTYAAIRGTASVAIIAEDLDLLVLATNCGSLYYAADQQGGLFVFASERFILESVIKTLPTNQCLKPDSTHQLKPNHVCTVDLKTLQYSVNNFTDPSSSPPLHYRQQPRRITNSSPKDTAVIQTSVPQHISSQLEKMLQPDTAAIKSLQRCSKCILPATMPFIEFDERGVCNYCRNYRPVAVRGADALQQALEPYRRTNGEPDCLVMFSGGRDSSYGLHYLKSILGMNPIAYSYDWGMITDLGRRNQARMCGQLGVEHIIVSADIKKKRDNIKKNVLAWLKKPDLGTIPLFMAGDKQYFYYANKIQRQTRTPLIIVCENYLERTSFKHGFCGITHRRTDSSPYFMSIKDKMKLILYYTKQFTINPAYLNSSILDTITGYAAYYFINHSYLYLYQYLTWDEGTINATLRSEYDWETAPDTKSTWRIGDGTAAFYNCLYYLIAGFTENDAFRSNQIREGILSRSEALTLTLEDNVLRFDSIQWYCDTIGIDVQSTLSRVMSIPKLYQPR